ncbi:MAG TPA: hypothetical protein VI997_07065 [Candidatus Thermoplasmatota archaeon]|nr:hypothetical protein [Candidatus Thermoplasmatota archaeon]
MRVVTLGLAVLASFTFVPTASAFGWCAQVGGIHHDNMGGVRCDGVFCEGYHGSGTYGYWDSCISADVHSPCDLIECYCTCPPVQSQPRILDVEVLA